jgi:hypothetical protein
VSLYLLWLIPISFVIWFLILDGYLLLRPVIELWWEGARRPARGNPYWAFPALVLAAIYAYFYVGLTLCRITAWHDAGGRVLAEHVRLVGRPMALYLRPFKADRRSVVLKPAEVYPTFKEALSEPIVHLLLAPFDWTLDSTERTRTRFDGTNFDQFLAPAFRSHFGELLAIGDPRDWLPRRGAARVYLRDVEWQSRVGALIETAQLVLFLAGEGPGLLWELRYLRQHAPARAVIMLTLPHRSASAWKAQVQALGESGWTVPTCDPGPGCVIAFDESYSGRLLLRGAFQAEDYARVIAAHAHGESPEPVQWPSTPPSELPSLLGLA